MTSFRPNETKAFPTHISQELIEAHDHMNTSFEAFKDANDQRLNEIELRGSSDVVVEDKLRRIEADLDRTHSRLDALQLKQARPAFETPTQRFGGEHGRAFDNYIRRGDAAGLGRVEIKTLSSDSNPDGGYTVPLEIDAIISDRLAQISPIRRIASVRQVSSAVYRKPFASTGFTVGWVGEQAIRPITNTPTLNALDFPSFELYAMPAATNSLLNDSAVDIERWIAEEVEQAFAEQEGRAFVIGNGTTQPRGFLTGTVVPESSWTWGQLGYVASGAASDFVATNPSDRLVDLVYALRSGYRQNASFVMNRRTQAVIRKYKDAQGQYLWQPPAQAGGVASLMTFPVVEAEDMPDIAANATPIAFGDFRRGYLVVDRVGTQVLRDPYSAKPYILFYTTKRVGGGIQDFNAIKLIRISLT